MSDLNEIFGDMNGIDKELMQKELRQLVEQNVIELFESRTDGQSPHTKV